MPNSQKLQLEILESRLNLQGMAIISEFMASNATKLADADGEFSDWVEIQNLSETQTVNLEGWFLSDASDNLTKWRFPAVTLAPTEQLVVFASGKNRTNPNSELHTNFKLSSAGEFLALVQPDQQTVASEFSPRYPEQYVNISFGSSADSLSTNYFLESTPGALNGPGQLGIAAVPSFSVAHGFYAIPFHVELITPTEGATILYTLDGSSPTETNGQLYSSPINIETTTVVRAATFRESFIPSRVETQSYIFVNDVVEQGNSPPGYPAHWSTLPADYEMDPEVTTHEDYRAILDNSLLSLPTISIVANIDDLFDPAKGIYQNTNERGIQWERPASVEFIYPDGQAGAQVDAGLRIQGRASRNPGNSPKHSFRLVFCDVYGAGKLEFTNPLP